jgi:hypothetical protein
MRTSFKLPMALAAALCVWLAADASALTPYQDNLQSGTGWDTSVSQDPAAISFGAGGLVISTNPGGDPNEFQRQATIYTARNDLDWVGEAGPITYSMTISDFATPMTGTSGGYEANLLLVGNEAAPFPNFADFNAADVLMLRVVDFGPKTFLAGANQYGAELWIKTNSPGQPDGTGGIFDGTKVAAFYNSTSGQLLNPNGTWSFTINPNGTAFITTPNGQVSTPGTFTGTGSLPAGAGASFNTANLYLQASNGSQIAGDSITFSSVAAIPEPSTILSMACGLGLVLGRFLMSRKRTRLV